MLIVDDDANLRETMREALAYDGHDVRCAGDGIEALEALRSFAPDVVILDVEMPRLSGRGVVAALQRAYGSCLPFTLVVTSSTASERAGLSRWFLPKPFSIDMLLQTVKDFWRARRSNAA